MADHKEELSSTDCCDVESFGVGDEIRRLTRHPYDEMHDINITLVALARICRPNLYVVQVWSTLEVLGVPERVSHAGAIAPIHCHHYYVLGCDVDARIDSGAICRRGQVSDEVADHMDAASIVLGRSIVLMLRPDIHTKPSWTTGHELLELRDILLERAEEFVVLHQLFEAFPAVYQLRIASMRLDQTTVHPGTPELDNVWMRTVVGSQLHTELLQALLLRELRECRLAEKASELVGQICLLVRAQLSSIAADGHHSEPSVVH